MTMCGDFTVRIATRTDAPVVSELLYEFNGEALFPQALAERMNLCQGLETAFLALLGEQPAGLAIVRIVPTLSGVASWAEITELYVRPPYRRQGAGRALIAAVQDQARTRGCTEIHLLVDPHNDAALAFYRTAGFRRDSWVLRREL